MTCLDKTCNGVCRGELKECHFGGNENVECAESYGEAESTAKLWNYKYGDEPADCVDRDKHARGLPPYFASCGDYFPCGPQVIKQRKKTFSISMSSYVYFPLADTLNIRVLLKPEYPRWEISNRVQHAQVPSTMQYNRSIHKTINCIVVLECVYTYICKLCQI